MSTVDSASLLIDGPWEHRYVAANGARFHVAVAGPDDRDAPLVVLLHGIPQFWWAWRHQLPALADAGYRVAAMDVRGTGGSDKPPVGYDVPTLAADVAGVIQSLGAADAVIVGSGTGGEIAWAMAGLQPDRVRAVAALAAPHPLDTRGHPRAAVRPSALRRLAFVQLPSFPEQALMEGDLVVAAPARVGRRPGLARPARGDDVPLRGARALRGAQPDGAAALDGPVDAPSRRPPLPRDARRRAPGRSPSCRCTAVATGCDPRPAQPCPRTPPRWWPRATSSSCCRRPGTTPRRRRRTASPTCS